MSTCAVLFTKKPEPGKVKTRLQSELGPEAAARLYRAFLLDCATELAASQAATKVIAYAPADAAGAMRDLLAEVGEFAYAAPPDTAAVAGRDRAATDGAPAPASTAGAAAPAPR